MLLHRRNTTTNRQLAAPQGQSPESQVTGIFFWEDLQVPKVVFKYKPADFLLLSDIHIAASPEGGQHSQPTAE